MRYALIGDGYVKAIVAKRYAIPGSELTYHQAAWLISKACSNEAMIAFMKERYPSISGKHPEKALADLFEAMIGWWSIESEVLAQAECIVYAAWCMQRFKPELTAMVS